MGHGWGARIERWINPAVLAGVTGGALAQALHWPLPWMMGAMLGLGAWRLSGGRGQAPRHGREAGQLVVASALGLHFTPDIAQAAAGHAPAVLAASGLALMLSGCGAWVLQRWGACDRVTAWLASVPGGASEMALMAERAGASVDRVAAAQALRVCLVVILLPLVLDRWQPASTSAGAWGKASNLPLAMVAVVLALGVAAAALWHRARGPTAWFLGPLLVVGLGSALGLVPAGNLPQPLVLAGQCLLGLALGARLERRFLREAPRFLLLVALSLGLLLILTATAAAGLAWWSGLPLADLVLASAPGGMAEMCATAESLGLGVAFITASHVLRLVVVLAVANLIRRRV